MSFIWPPVSIVTPPVASNILILPGPCAVHWRFPNNRPHHYYSPKINLKNLMFSHNTNFSSADAYCGDSFQAFSRGDISANLRVPKGSIRQKSWGGFHLPTSSLDGLQMGFILVQACGINCDVIGEVPTAN